MAYESHLSQNLINVLAEIYPNCLFEEQARRVLLSRGFTISKTHWRKWKELGGELLYSEGAEDIEHTEYEQLLIQFFMVLNNIGAEIDQRCINNISAQFSNPKNSEFNWRVLKLRNRGEYDEKSVIENQVSGSLEINSGSLLDAIKQAKLAEVQESKNQIKNEDVDKTEQE